MLRVLQNINGGNVDAQKKAAANLKRGTFVKVNEKAGTLVAATAIADVNGILTRDFNVTQETAMGFAVSEYDDSQDLVKSGEYAGVINLLVGGRFATSEYDAALTDALAEADKYLTVTNGKLATSSTATAIVSLGWIMDADMHKLLGFKIVK